MSRFYIQQKLCHIRKSLLQGPIKEWDLIDANTFIAFDCSGNYAVLRLDDSEVSHRGTARACPRAVLTLPRKQLVYVTNSDAIILDYEHDKQLLTLSLEGCRLIDEMKKTKSGFMVLSTNPTNVKRLFIYSGGENWQRIINIDDSHMQIDLLQHSTLVKFSQFRRVAVPEDFKFVVMDIANDYEQRVFNCGADLKMQVLRIHPLGVDEYIILGTSGCETLAYTVKLNEQAVELNGPIKVSTNRMIDVLQFEEQHLSICLLTALTNGLPSKQECVQDAQLEKCVCCIEVFDIRRLKTLSRLYVPNYNRSKPAAEHHIFALQHYETKQVQEAPFRLVKLVHQNQLYVHLMKHIKIEQQYGADMVIRAIGLLENQHRSD